MMSMDFTGGFSQQQNPQNCLNINSFNPNIAQFHSSLAQNSSLVPQSSICNNRSSPTSSPNEMSIGEQLPEGLSALLSQTSKFEKKIENINFCKSKENSPENDAKMQQASNEEVFSIQPISTETNDEILEKLKNLEKKIEKLRKQKNEQTKEINFLKNENLNLKDKIEVGSNISTGVIQESPPEQVMQSQKDYSLSSIEESSPQSPKY